jgi:hypothetical protein
MMANVYATFFKNSKLCSGSQGMDMFVWFLQYEGLPKISENLNILRKR